VAGSVRVVRVEDFDASACCGTHARSTGETGVIQVLGVDRAKGQPRVEFVCGWRALRRARANSAALRAIGATVSAAREDVVAGVERLATEAAQARKSLASTERRLAAVHAVELQSAAVVRGRARFVVELIPDRDIKYLQALASHIVSGAGYAVVLGGNVGGSCLLVARSQDLDIDVRPIGRDALAVIAGRGGGPAHMVQGGGPGPDVRAAMKMAEERLRAELQ
jgi:alanyl-tRNA synthetase